MTGAGDDVRQRRTYVVVVLVALVVGIAFALSAPDRDVRDDAPVAAQATPTSITLVAEQPSTTTEAPATSTVDPATTEATRKSTTVAPTTTTVDPGSLPQTDAKPTATGSVFDAGAQALWQAIVRDEPDTGHLFFFPRAAYLQVKAISDPGSDYQNRLLASFAEDVHALHARLGASAARAQFVGISVPEQAAWVVPGQEYNQLPYWRVYGTTLRYTLDGVEQSFPVTSLISWRGEWYVVHLGVIR